MTVPAERRVARLRAMKQLRRTIHRRRAVATVIGLAVMVAVIAGASTSVWAFVTPSSGTTTTTAGFPKVHTNKGYAAPTRSAFSIECYECHSSHKVGAASAKPAGGSAMCAKCHEPAKIHLDPTVQANVAASASPADCVSCHPHSEGFMAGYRAVDLTVSEKTTGYDDVDGSGALSPGDRVHYRIDYANPGQADVTGGTIVATPDAAHTASVKAISNHGKARGTEVKWSVGTVAAGATGFVTYDAVLPDETGFPPAVGTIKKAAASDVSASGPGAWLPVTAELAGDVVFSADHQLPVSAGATVSVVLPFTYAELVNSARLSAEGLAPATASLPVQMLVGPATPATGSKASDQTTTTTDAKASDQTTTTDPAGGAAGADQLVALKTTANATEPAPKTGGAAKVMAKAGAVSDISFSQQVRGYDDLDNDGNLSAGDRVYYRIDYVNPDTEPLTGASILDTIDPALVASVEAVSSGGTVLADNPAQIPAGIRWDLGTLAPGAGGHVTFAAVLRGHTVMVKDDWAFPVQGTNSYSDTFGADRFAGGFHLHQGTDIMTALGTPLVAVVDGTISSGAPDGTGLGGVCLSLKGIDGNRYYYAHLSAIQDGIVEGAHVTMGQVLGFAGNTGDAEGGPVHCHFEIHPGGGPAIDPYLVLKGEKTVDEIPPALPGNILAAEAVAAVAQRAGFSGDSLVTAVAVALAESRGNANAIGDVAIGGSYGLWQIFCVAHPDLIPPDDPNSVPWNDPYQNAVWAYQISGGGINWQPWTTYRNGAYLSCVPTALAAVDMLLGGATTTTTSTSSTDTTTTTDASSTSTTSTTEATPTGTTSTTSTTSTTTPTTSTSTTQTTGSTTSTTSTSGTTSTTVTGSTDTTVTTDAPPTTGTTSTTAPTTGTSAPDTTTTTSSVTTAGVSMPVTASALALPGGLVPATAIRRLLRRWKRGMNNGSERGTK